MNTLVLAGKQGKSAARRIETLHAPDDVPTLWSTDRHGHISVESPACARIVFATPERLPYLSGQGLDGAWCYCTRPDIIAAWVMPALADKGGWLVRTSVEVSP